MIKCNLINLETGQIIKARSVADFCRQTNMDNPRDKIHIYPVLRGERLHHRGWATIKTFNTKLSLSDIYGNIYKGSVAKLMFKDKISPQRLWNLMTGKRKVVSGMFLTDSGHTFIPPKNYKVKEYQFETPNNKIVKTSSIKTLCKILGNRISDHSLFDIARGKTTNVKGYKFHGAILEKKSVLNESEWRPKEFKSKHSKWRNNKNVSK